MRIISSYHDYYDSALAFGHDPNVTYIRETVEIPFNFESGERFPSFERSNSDGFNSSNLAAVPTFVGFCGKVRTCFVVSYFLNDSISSARWKTFYDVDTLTAFLLKFEDTEFNDRFLRKDAYYWSTFASANCTKFLTQDFTSRFSGLFTQHSVPVFKIDKTGLTLNPKLREIEFQKVMDPYTAFQEIDMFISGVLGVPTRVTLDISDKMMLQKKGFDKTSFKTLSPGKKLRRRGGS
jgi:hypothetical protein